MTSGDKIQSTGHEANVRELIGWLTRGQCFEADGFTLIPSMKNTPARFLKAWHDELCSGYDVSDDDIATMLTQFDSEKYDEIIVLKNVEFFSLCEHHMMPFTGTAHVAYLPDKEGKVVGLSKLARLLDVYSRRMQMQERITWQVTSALMKHLQPRGAACILKAKHFCVCSRGINKQQSEMVTASKTGVFRNDLGIKIELERMLSA